MQAGRGKALSVMIMNGTKDPLVPFNGGEVNLFGMFYKGGKVRSSRESGQYFADLNHIAGTPETKRDPRGRWSSASSRCSGATTPKWRWNSLPFTAVDMASRSHTGAVRGY